MKMLNSVAAQYALAVAEARIKFIAGRIEFSDCTDEEKFKLMWELVFVHLQGLENFRVPE